MNAKGKGAGAKAGNSRSIGLAFQGGSFLAGAVEAGVVRAFAEAGVFDDYTVSAFSGTSAGALVAAVCWRLALQERMADAPGLLERQWLHFANGSIPSEAWGDFWRSFDNAARGNPFYDVFADNLRVPWIKSLFGEWIDQYVDPKAAVERLYHRDIDRPRPRPRLVLGAANVLDGEIVAFTDRHFLTELRRELRTHSGDIGRAVEAGAALMRSALMASGSLDEINGMTTIAAGPHRGTYLDGAWGANPPIREMIDFCVDEIWIVEIFPKFRERLPRNHAEREDRKEELWQNAFVEHQVHMIRRVNEWLASGRMFARYEDYAALHGDRAMPNNEWVDYRHIEVRRLPMTLDFTPGARIVNAPSFLREKMEYGAESARHFLKRLPDSPRPLLPLQ